MDKTYLRATSQEIVVNGGTSDGRVDVFSYGPGSSDSFKQLGNLFIIGQASHERDDVGYAVNLVAALAKREYYADPASTPKAAFTRMLKKINEAVDDFFKNKGLTMNIGIFAVAGDHIVISKLGKFKILLARDKKTVDILNNVADFEKELVEKKEFSNIISGKLSAQDKILAFYPTPSMTSRERFIKNYFLSMEPDAFSQKVQTIGSTNSKFTCALLHVSLQQVRERVRAPRIEPREIMEAQLAAEPVSPGQQGEPSHSRMSGTGEPAAPSQQPPTAPEDKKESANSPQTPATDDDDEPSPEPEEVPRIIPSEFSLGKRSTALGTLVRKMKLLNVSPRGRAIVGLVVVALIVTASLGAKSLFFVSPAERALRQTLSDADTNLKLAQTKITQNDVLGARMLLASTLASINALGNDAASSEDSQQTVRALFSVLDGIDRAKEAVPSMVYQLPEGVGSARLVARAPDGTLVVYTVDEQAGTGYLIRVQGETLKEKLEVKGADPSILSANNDVAVLVQPEGGRVVLAKEGKVQTMTLDITQSLDASFYEGNLYVLTAEGVYKVADIVQGKTKATPWLASGVTLAPGPLFLTVDGNVNVLSTNGTVTVYYKGKKAGEASTGLIPVSDNIFSADIDAPSFFLVEKQNGRMYVIDKKTLSLILTLKVGSTDPIISAAPGPENSVYFITKDNKIWKAQ